MHVPSQSKSQCESHRPALKPRLQEASHPLLQAVSAGRDVGTTKSHMASPSTVCNVCKVCKGAYCNGAYGTHRRE